MARFNTISDGQPFTYQLLNQIIESLNDVRDAVGEAEEADITIKGPGEGSQQRPLIIYDRTTVEIPENQTAINKTAKFRTNFSNDNPVVLATIVDPDAEDGTPMGYITIKNVTQKDFTYRIKLIRKRTKTTNLQINYIAIGAEPK